ncbi:MULTISPECIES: DUF3000 domain-containing protein [Allobranchiibius]|uniref:Enoyl-CoA hydratase n=1 Tax=Allobranchiibius huperziae TaxID=1874116 RepID=A0A853DG83_9MICO|nr:DUF3000 domain-containing protein [Allobranchiibius sp. GilTou73]MBO1766809.1 DUF3000 domain-containing protein [Allobranchiibius sp. GilTou38]NYJ74969.1 hypothetical protein [Allobranchiibius huperziae]UIJ33670.1 DUF3000 domain-containing protein [Allobranchiibius sp. GilTou73]
MGTRNLGGDAAADFQRATREVEAVGLRPEVRLTEVPAPTRIAPYAVALTAEVVSSTEDDDELASGRFVLLHDPSEPEAWGGAWRVVSFARAELEPEMATDPMLGDVGWSWLTDSLQSCDAHAVAEAGTVTRVVSQGYGGLVDNGTSVEMEVRASWTPVAPGGVGLGAHFEAWGTLLCTIAGLPPLPEGVVALPGQRR